jgi:diguanylate cyclase (GGDEF)-like protein
VKEEVRLKIRVRLRLSRILEWLDHESKGFLILVAILLDVLIGLLDHFSGYEISFSIFYLIPVFLVSRCKGRTEGVVICCVCAGTWLAADLGAGHEYSQYWIPYWNALVRLGFFLAVCLSLVSMRCSMESLEEHSRTDPLTGAANLRGFTERAQVEIDRSLRYGHPITVAYLDVDDFKAINDNFGHSIGDEVLTRIAELTLRKIRKTDILGRLGGDEFAILFPQTEPESAKVVLKRIRENLSEEMRIRGWTVTFSGGAATFKAPPSSVDEMIKKADDLMYEAKRRGKNNWVFGTFPDRDRRV